MQVRMAICKRRLATVWFVGGGIVFLIVILQTVLGRFGDKAATAWGWLLPSIMPTLSLIIGVLVTDALGKGVEIAKGDSFLYKVTLGLSVAYLGAVLLTILIAPFAPVTPLRLMEQSNLWLGPMQGLVAASLGAFFIKRQED